MKGRHRRTRFSLTVEDVRPRPWFVQPIRQVVVRTNTGERWLEQIDIYGRYLFLGHI